MQNTIIEHNAVYSVFVQAVYKIIKVKHEKRKPSGVLLACRQLKKNISIGLT